MLNITFDFSDIILVNTEPIFKNFQSNGFAGENLKLY